MRAWVPAVVIGLSLSVSCSETGSKGQPSIHTAIEDTSSLDGDTAVVSLELVLEPSSIRVDVGAQWLLRAVGPGPLGALQDVDARFSSSNEQIVAVNERGLASALMEGEVELVATFEGAVAKASVVVQDTGVLSVTVVHAVTGDPIQGARVLDADENRLTDDSGRAELSVSSGTPVWLSAYGAPGQDLTMATFIDVVARDIVVPLRPNSAEAGGQAVAQGTVDFSNTVPGGSSEKGEGVFTAGIAMPSLQHGPLLFDVDALFGPMKAVDVGGVEILVPENLYEEDWVPRWSTSVYEGPLGIWTFAGLVPLADIVSALQEGRDAFSFLLPHIDGFTHGWTDGLVAENGVPLEIELAPSNPVTESIEVHVPPNPAGFSQSQEAMLVALGGEGPEGPAVVGLGKGTGVVTLGRVPSEAYGFSREGGVAAYLEVGGNGTGGPRVLTYGAVVEGVVELTAWQEPPDVSSFSGISRRYSLTTDAGAQLARVHIESRDGRQRDLYLPSGPREGELDTEGQTMGYGITTWKLLSIDADRGTYQSMLVDGGLRPEVLRRVVRTTGMVTRDFRD